MITGLRVLCLALGIGIGVSIALAAQAPQQTPAQMVAAQQAAIAKIAYLDGIWRGSGWMIDRPGETPRQMTMTYRVGPFLDGTVRIIEIRGYLADGKLGFHAFNTVSFDSQTGQYVMNARAAGRSGAFSFQAAGERNYAWQIGSLTAGLHYTGKVENGVWTEIGRAISPGAEPVIMSDYTLRRVGDTDWPEAGALGPR